MKIECPTCQLTGKINELELPPLGKDMTCPRCKKSFHVAKPETPAAGKGLMNTCPACQYSTFTDEMFAECPKCGMTHEKHQVVARKQREREQAQRDQEAIHRSHRNPDLIQTPISAPVPETVRPPQPIEVTAWLCMALAAGLMCYGVRGLVKYYSKDWQAILSEPVLEPVSKIFVFFNMGFIPWVVTLFSFYLLWAGYQFWRVREESLEKLAQGAWGGIAVAVIYQAVAFAEWVRVSSSEPSLLFYLVGVVSALFWSILLSVPFFTLLWFLRTDNLNREFRKAKLQAAE